MELDVVPRCRIRSQLTQGLARDLRRAAKVARASQLPSGGDGSRRRSGSPHARIVAICGCGVGPTLKKIANFDRFCQPGPRSDCRQGYYRREFVDREPP